MLGRYNEREKKKAVNNWLETKKLAVKGYLSKRRRLFASLAFFMTFGLAACVFVIPSVTSEEFMHIAKITPKNMNRLSEDAFRKIIGYDYDEKVYVKDTAEIRARLTASDMIYDVRFTVKLIPYELEVEVSESGPLFIFMRQGSDSLPLVYSNKGKIYPYSVNIAALPVVEVKNSDDIALATDFLINMKKNDALLYSKVSQLIPSEEKRQVSVFFNDVDFKTKFSADSSYWKESFKHYRLLTGNAQVLNINNVATLDLRFKKMAYTVEKQEMI